jgi:hypothetical protein
MYSDLFATRIELSNPTPTIPQPGKVKAKVKLSLCLTKHHAMKTYWGVEV